MQSSSEKPAGETGHDNEETGNEIEQAASPLYEFPADSSLLQGAHESSQVTDQDSGDDMLRQPSQESIQQGLVYPPPPSFYQNMQVPLARPPLPLQPGPNVPFTPHPTGPQGQLYPSGMQVPPFPPVQFPGPQPPVKRSYKWVWIIVSIFAAGLLVSGGLCAWAFYTLFNSALQQESGSINVVNDYFKQIHNQAYANAYRDLQISGLTQDDFIAQAQASDTQNGLILSFVVHQPMFVSNPDSGPDLSQWRLTVDVTRAKTSYPVLLSVKQIGGKWKITYYDRI
jgi:hypothetical protein